MTISQFFVLSPRGDTLLSREYRSDVPATASEVFFRKMKFWKGDAPPIFIVDGVNYIHVRKSGLNFVCTTKFNVSPCFAVELVNRIARVFKDYCGMLTEEALRKNFVLLYELLDELLDYGFAQGTSTEILKAYVHNEPVPVASMVATMKASSMGGKTTPSTSVNKPITMGAGKKGKQKNEIYVDILERLTMTFSANGYVLNSAIDGCIQMKSYLSGNPGLRIALSEDLVIGKGAAPASYGSVVLDDCNFHECVRLDEFGASKVLTMVPPDGEFVVMNYRVSGDFRPPFRLEPVVEEMSKFRMTVIVKLRAEVPEKNYGNNVVVRFAVPRGCNSVTPQVTGDVTLQNAEYLEKERAVVWHIKKFQGQTEMTLKTSLVLAEEATPSTRRQIGPITTQFEIPMYNASNLQVKSLRIAETSKSYKPLRWVRYVTQSSSYVCRV